MSKRQTKKKTRKFNLKIYIGLIISAFAGIVSLVFYFGFSKDDIFDISFYQNIANPSVRIVKVYPGLRKEEIAQVFYKNLNWTESDAKAFARTSTLPSDSDTPIEGRLLPKTYLLDKDATPAEVQNIMLDEFDKAFEKIKNKSNKKLINEDVIIKIASIIQREASGKKDMPLISGIIWNRFWADMNLEIDATLQYVKGNERDGWWQIVHAKDRKLDSPYNTYLYGGFPPGAISNPSLDAIYAAYNPIKTECLFYIHDKNKKTHCAKTYEEHKKNIEKYLQ